jgi:hypothetical protein
MAQQTVNPYGTIEVSVPIGQKIAISTSGGDNVTIWYQTNDGVSPVGWYVHDVISNEEVELGTFSGVQGVRIDTQSSSALYDIGVSPSVGVGDASTLNGLTSDQFLRSDTADTAVGPITFPAAIVSTVATGTAPLTIASTTAVSNLNADQTDGYDADEASTASTLAARDASGNLTANVLISDVATGTAPLTVASTTAVSNLNVDQVDGEDAADFVHIAGAETITGAKTFREHVVIETPNGEATRALRFDNKTTGVYDFDLYVNSDGLTFDCLKANDKIYVNEDGRLGIGATPGNYYLRVVADETGDDYDVAEFSNSDGITVKIVGDGSGADSVLQHTITGERNFTAGIDGADGYKYKLGPNGAVASNTSIVVDGSGNVGCGTATPSQRFELSGAFLMQNTNEIQSKDSGGTGRTILYVDGSDVCHAGEANLATNIRSNGTLTYNGASLATGSIDTTASQTITVVDGLITNIA